MTKKNRKSAIRKEADKKGHSKGKMMGDRKSKSSPEDRPVVRAPKKARKDNRQREMEAEKEIEANDEEADAEMEEESEPEPEPEPEPEVVANKRPTFCIKQADFVQLSPELASRLLHPNPCCFLTSVPTPSKDPALKAHALNAMTLSWLSPANNYGGFVFVIHKTRFSADCIVNGSGKFTLSVAHAGLRDVLLACGKISGKVRDKFNDSVVGLKAAHAAQLCAINDKSKQFSASNAFSALGDGSDSDEEEEEEEKEKKGDQGAARKSRLDLDDRGFTIAPPVQGTVAHMSCRVIQKSDAADAGHWLVTAQIEDAFVHTSYWDGKCFQPKLPDLPPLVSFLGSQRFGFVVPEE